MNQVAELNQVIQVQLVVGFYSGLSVVLFDTLGISRVSVESSSLTHYRSYP